MTSVAISGNAPPPHASNIAPLLTGRTGIALVVLTCRAASPSNFGN